MIVKADVHTREAVIEALKRAGIVLTLFDLDDTLVKTHEIFVRRI